MDKALEDSFQRVIQLEGGCNLRDLGGYQAADGRRVRSGMLYRSGVLAYLTDRDRQQLSVLNVQVICDLRRIEEREHEPTLWPEGAEILAWDDDESGGKNERSWNQARDGEQCRDIMLNLYRTMPKWLHLRLRGVFESLAGGRVPLLFHCAAGKDRTGLTAALILHMIGVPRETIVQDYLLTNEAVDLEQFTSRYRRAGLGLSDQAHPISLMPADVRRALIMADADYLNSALGEIETEFGSIEQFLLERIDVQPVMVTEIRDRLLA